MMKQCALSVMAAVTDVAFLPHTLPHLSRACAAFPLSERVIFIDNAPLSGAFRGRPNVGTPLELNSIAERLVCDGYFDRVEHISYDRRQIANMYRRHFGTDLGFAHDFRGYPIYGVLHSLESCEADYVLHLDSDMLMHAPSGENWIGAAIDLYEAAPDVLFLSPRSGPPRADGVLHQRGVPYWLDSRGFYAFSDFTSRKFLVSKRRLESVLPIAPHWISWKRWLASRVISRSALWSWEFMISQSLKVRGMLRGDMAAPVPWTLHTPDHGPRFIAALPELIHRVEAGDVPSGQAGHYDLDLNLWLATSETAV